MIKAIKWTAINGAMFACLWVGLNGYSQGVLNIGLFFTWFSILASLLLLSTDVREEMEADYSVPQWVDVTFDVSVIMLLVFHGYMFTAGMYVVHTILRNIVRNFITDRDQ